MSLLIKDIKEVYTSTEKIASGEFGEGLELRDEDNGVSLWGYTYLAGRRAGKMPPVKNILNWVQVKGAAIFGIKTAAQASSLAWAIAIKIKKEGTNKEYHLKVYDQVITPERIQMIIDEVTKFNVNEFVHSVTAELKKLTTNI